MRARHPAAGPLLCAAITLSCALACALAPAHAGPTRLALVIGNDAAPAAEVELPPLLHAERDARRLRDALVRHGRFPAEGVELVVGGGRAAVLAAAERLVARHRAVRAQVGEQVPTLFALFFTGHGLRGALLTRDGPLDGSDLGRIFTAVDATVSFGLFDACHSGAFDAETLRVKGIAPTPGFNPAAALPTELLGNAGTLWLSSSQPDEVSYEDPAVGSLFTHYFIEAFTAAERDGPGVDVDAMWRYARRRTVAHAARFGRRQTPVRHITRLESSGPLLMSFPSARRARLVLDGPLSGPFVLRMADGALVERVDKRAGEPLEVPVFPGRLQIGPPGGRPWWTVELAPGDRLALGQTPPAAPPGIASETIAPMGGDPTARLVRARAAASWHMGAGYGFAGRPATGLGPWHRIALAAHRVDGGLGLGLRAGYGRRAHAFSAWQATVDAPFAAIEAGWGLIAGRWRFDLLLGAELEYARVDYSDRSRAVLAPGADLNLRAWTRLWGVGWALRGGVRVGWTEGLAIDDTARRLHLGPAVGLEALWP